MDHTDRGQTSVVIDDSTGKPAGVALLPAIQDALKAAGLGIETPTRGANGASGSASAPGTLVANVSQQAVPHGVLVARSGRHPTQPGR